jgi:hypothetical protein
VSEALQQYNRLINYYYENLDNDTWYMRSTI